MIATYQSPRTNIGHLSRNGRYTFCGYRIGYGWNEANGVTSKMCRICVRIQQAEDAVRPAAPNTTEVNK